MCLKRLVDPFKRIGGGFVGAAAQAVLIPYLLGIAFIIYSVIVGNDTYMNCGVISIVCAAAVQMGLFIVRSGHGTEISDYDRSIIGSGFSYGEKKSLFLSGYEKMHEGRFDEASEDFCELKKEKLTDSEQGALGFYMAVCYSRMGYPTNAGHCACTAVEKKVHINESLLLAARSFSQAGSLTDAAECYEQLLPIAEQKMLYPFIYNEMGKMYLSSNMPQKSRECFQKALEKGLDPITAQGGLALTDLLEGRVDDACERYRLALISRITDTEGFVEYSRQICTANGYPADFFETRLRDKYGRSR